MKNKSSSSSETPESNDLLFSALTPLAIRVRVFREKLRTPVSMSHPLRAGEKEIRSALEEPEEIRVVDSGSESREYFFYKRYKMKRWVYVVEALSADFGLLNAIRADKGLNRGKVVWSKK